MTFDRLYATKIILVVLAEELVAIVNQVFIEPAILFSNTVEFETFDKSANRIGKGSTEISIKRYIRYLLWST